MVDQAEFLSFFLRGKRLRVCIYRPGGIYIMKFAIDLFEILLAREKDYADRLIITNSFFVPCLRIQSRYLEFKNCEFPSREIPGRNFETTPHSLSTLLFSSNSWKETESRVIYAFLPLWMWNDRPSSTRQLLSFAFLRVAFSFSSSSSSSSNPRVKSLIGD